MYKNKKGNDSCPECGGRSGASSAIDESITAGWGELDELGFWEFRCETCTKRLNDAWNKKRRHKGDKGDKGSG